MPRSTHSVRSRIGSATTIEEIVHSLAKRGCFDLSSSIDSSACSKFPRAGGGYCDVYRGALYDGTGVAIKTLRIYDEPEAEQNSNSRKILKRAARELYHWSKLQHPNVLPLMGLAVFRGQISMISKWMENGTLMGFLRLNQDADRPTICADICEGLCYIHANGVVHGDLKGANIMISPDGTAMIADFGNTRLKDFTLRFSTTAKCGYSVRWAAPELLLEDSCPQVSKEADVYAYGMTILEALTGRVPYEGIGDNRILILVAVEKKVPTRPSVDMPDDLWNLLNSCWNREPSKRPKIARVREGLQALSWFPSDSQLLKSATPNQTQHHVKSGGSEEGLEQVRGSPSSHYSTRNGTGTVSKSGLYNDATATSVTAVARPPLSPEPWNEPNSLGRHAKAEDAAMSAHARALEQARKLVAGEDDDEEEEEETQGYVSMFGDQSGRSYFDDEEESTEESSGEETESSMADRQERQPWSLGDLHYPRQAYDYPHRDRDDQLEASNVPAITINSLLNEWNVSSVLTRITDEDRQNEPSEFRMKSFENEPLDYDEFPSLDPPNHYGPPSPSAGHYDGLPAPYDHAPSSSWRSPGMGLQPPSLPEFNFAGFDGGLDSPEYEPTNNVPPRSNPSHTSGQGSSNGFSRPGTAQPPPPPLIITPESSSQPSLQRAANSSLASLPTANKSPSTNFFGVPGSGFIAQTDPKLEVGLAEVGRSFERSPSSIPDPAPEPAPARASSHYGQPPRAKDQEAKQIRKQELERIGEQEFEKARQRELERVRERQREKAESRQSHQPVPAAPIMRKLWHRLRFSRGPSSAKQTGPSPVSGDRQTPSPVSHIISPRPHIAPPSWVVQPLAKIVEGPSKPLPCTPATPITSQPHGRDEMRPLAPPQAFVDTRTQVASGQASQTGMILSGAQALVPAQRAFTGTHRPAPKRIFWGLTPDRDPRVRHAIAKIKGMKDAIVTFGAEQFVETRMRGAVICNVGWHPEGHPDDLAFDWITYKDAQKTRDPTLQKAVARTDPAATVLVVIFLLSASLNSLAIWRMSYPIAPGKLSHLLTLNNTRDCRLGEGYGS